MNEKLYKTLGVAGGVGIAIGVVEIITGLVFGILTIVGGAKLLRSKTNITF
jgi:hypothetical protein